MSLHSENGLYVVAEFRDDGALEISGQDLSGAMGWEEYEYVITVLPDDLPTLAAALGGQPGADVMEIIYAKRRVIMARGEEAWLRDHGIPTEFCSRIEPAG
ncbi:hypothetical protein BJ986_002265 [Phycicoccus badiiscoriae]|uniref:Uncharacterized protein n=1 Tax=Pedococcus badiiscoriae TaxID=642776 RepID=A0A852WFL8_9MICO|nr:hypothetical protein [Pedococcus badiiscoriae]NYG07778.1 hypothetical protein [Pedococcus badiiscoriae]